MNSPNEELVFSILQFLNECEYKKTLRKLEQESKIFFNWNYFEEIVIIGEWKRVEKYLSAFTNLNDNRCSAKIFFLIRRQKYLEALDSNDHERAVNILWDDLAVFSDLRGNLYAEFAELIALKNFREHKNLSGYLDNVSERASLQGELKMLVERNPILKDKLMFPNMEELRLWKLLFNLINHNPEQQTRIIKSSVSDTMASLKRELVFIILKFLDDQQFKGTLHKLEQESKIFFNMNYFEQCVTNGEWEKSEKYLSSFTKLDVNRCSIKIFFDMRKQKYLEALDRNDHDKAVNILWKELNAFKDFDDNIYKEFAELCLLKNFRENKSLSVYSDTASERANVCHILKTLVNGNPIFQDKLVCRNTDTDGLLALIKKTLHMWNDYCPYFMPNGSMETILMDNVHRQPYISVAPFFDLKSSIHSAGARDFASLANLNCGVGIESTEKSAIWELTEIKEPSKCHTLVLPDKSLAGRVAGLIYSHSGDFILGLTHNATHKLWRWPSDQHWTGKENATVLPQIFQRSSGIVTTNEINAHPKNALPCFALTKTDSYLFSLSGGEISQFILKTLEAMGTIMLPPSPIATYLAILPRNNDILAIGFEDSSIKIYYLHTNKVKARLEGHQKRITFLAFSEKLNVLVSSGADGQICVWRTNGWERQANIFLQTAIQQFPDPPIVNHFEFHKDQIQLLAVHERQIDMYAAPKLEHLKKLVLQDWNHPITHAAYSCDGQSIYVSFKDGSVAVYVSSTLRLRCLINLAAYTQPDPSLKVYPLVVAAHPSEPNQFALGLTNGRVHVLEPLESDGEWGIPPPPEDGNGHSMPLV